MTGEADGGAPSTEERTLFGRLQVWMPGRVPHLFCVLQLWGSAAHTAALAAAIATESVFLLAKAPFWLS